VPTAHHCCSVPGCGAPPAAFRGGYAYCGPHAAELNLVRRLLARLGKPPRRRPSPTLTVPHPDPRRASRARD